MDGDARYRSFVYAVAPTNLRAKIFFSPLKQELHRERHGAGVKARVGILLTMTASKSLRA
jgi:hypothetical protein